MVFRFKCFDFPSPPEIDDGHNGQTQSPSSQRGGKSSQTKSSSAESYYSAPPNFDLSSSEWQNDLEVFSYLDLERATENFSSSFKIGEGDFGSIYKAVIQFPNEKQVMVKHLNERYIQGHKEWAIGLDSIGSVKHPNLVKLVGYCADDKNRLPRVLVYEYFPKGSVTSHLSVGHGASLPWITRIKIAQDVAYSLAYLHGALDFQLMLGNFKSSNVLLDDYWNAKLFCSAIDRSYLSKELNHLTIAAIENIGRKSSDVWSYGVFLCQLITGGCSMNEQEMVEQVKPHLNSRECMQIVDSRLLGHCSLQSVVRLSRIANRCLASNPKARPKMIEVVAMVTTIQGKGKRRRGASSCLTPLF